MRISSIATKRLKNLKGNEAGVTLIESLIALALVGIIAVTFLIGLSTASKATLITDKHATAESLVRTGMEYIKSQDYIDYNDPGHGSYALITPPTNYSILLTTTPVDPSTGLSLPSGDLGIQKITLTVKLSDESVLTINDYKVNR